MRKSRFSLEQIKAILVEHEAGASAGEMCRKYGISSATFYKWKAKHGKRKATILKRAVPAAKGERAIPILKPAAIETASDSKRLKALEEENMQLRRLLVEALLENARLKNMKS